MEEAARDRAERFREIFVDERTFRSWYNRALPVVYSFVFARAGNEAEVAVDITQDTFVEGVRSRNRFDGSSDPLTWLCGIARHKIADHYRRLERERRRLFRLIRGRGPEETFQEEQFETREAVAGALRSLPPAQQAVLTMHYLDEMPVKEIASALGRSASSVESLLARGRQSFKRAYRPSGGADDG